MNSDTELLRRPHPAKQKLLSSFKTLKPLAILIIILLIVIIAGTGGYLLGIRTHQEAPQSTQRAYIQPSPTSIVQPTAFPSSLSSAQTMVTMSWEEWKMYTNEALGLSFNYPKDWEVKSSSDNKSEKGRHVVDIVAPTETTVISLFTMET
jgi:hypothetical protein